MDTSLLASLLGSKRITAAQHRKLSSIVRDGIVDPRSDAATPGAVRLWFAHLPRDGALGGAIADVGTLIAKSTAGGAMQLVTLLGRAEVRKCGAFNTCLREWLGVTQDPSLLAPVCFAWLRLAGLVDVDDAVGYETLTLDRVRDDP